jgi:hypothetical protein
MRQIERPLQPGGDAGEGPLVTLLAAPHPAADPDRVFEQLVALGEGRVGDAQPARLGLVVAGADAEPGAATGDDIQRGCRLGEQARMAVRRGRRQGKQLGAAGVGGQERQGRVALQHRPLGGAHHRVPLDVVHDGDRGEHGRLARPPVSVMVGPIRSGATG